MEEEERNKARENKRRQKRKSTKSRNSHLTLTQSFILSREFPINLKKDINYENQFSFHQYYTYEKQQGCQRLEKKCEKTIRDMGDWVWMIVVCGAKAKNSGNTYLSPSQPENGLLGDGVEGWLGVKVQHFRVNESNADVNGE